MNTLRTWKPAVGVITITGVLTTGSVRAEYCGKPITATLVMSAATAVSNGAVISGAPRAT